MKSNSGADGLFGDNRDKLQICNAAPTQVQTYRFLSKYDKFIYLKYTMDYK